MINIHDFDMTSDTTLDKICKDLKIKLNWIGFEHLIYNQKYKDGGYILNIGDDTGTHWICLNVLDKNVFYFDSFAVPPNNEVIEWCNRNGVEKLSWNNKEQFQQMDEQLCGLWCIIALYYLQKKKNDSLDERFNQMSKDI